MRKKKEIATDFYTCLQPLMQCPLCGSSFKANELLTCDNQHHFTMNKQGFFHFVNNVPHNDYNKEMLTNRRYVIRSGLYDKVLAEIAKHFPQKMNLFIDAGAGEGSFMDLLDLSCLQWGIDLSKDGISLASDYNTMYQGFAVADLTKVPLKDSSVDCILNFLSPAMYEEFNRLLTKKGVLIKVVPGASYLQEIRSLLYTGTKKENYDNKQVINHFQDKMQIITTQKVIYKKKLTTDVRDALWQMSPLSWHANIDDHIKQQLQEITIDLEILVGQKKK